MYTFQLHVSTVVGNEVTEVVSMHRKKCWRQLTRKRELHWLPVKQRIDHKIMPLAYKCYEVLRRNTCRNSFPDTFMHDPFSHHRNHAYWFQVLLKNTLTSSLVSEPFPTLLPSSGMLYHKQSGKQTRRRFANVWKLLLCEWLCTMCLFLLLVYDFLSIHSPPPPPPRAFKLIETSYKARHHQQQQLKATKQSISLRQPSTTPCSHGSWDSLKWDGCVCGGGGVHRLPITPTHPASWWWREGLHTSSPSESVIFSNRF